MFKISNTPKIKVFNIKTQISEQSANYDIVTAIIIFDKIFYLITADYYFKYKNNDFSDIFVYIRLLYTPYIYK
jgi:hypothetical protein